MWVPELTFMQRSQLAQSLLTGLTCVLIGAGACCLADESTDLRDEVRQLRKIVEQQQQTIDSLNRKVVDLESGKSDVPEPAMRQLPGSSKVLLSGEAGVAFFVGGHESRYPNAMFRVDEAKLFVDAQLMNNAYFFAELNLTQREEPDESLTLGEIGRAHV